MSSSGDFLLLAVGLALSDPQAQAQASQASVGPLVGALLGSLVFAGALFACSRDSVTFSMGCCAVTEDDNTAPWSKGAVAAKWRFLGASYLFLQGYALLAAGFTMPWTTFSSYITLPLLAASGAATCGSSTTTSTPLQALCTGGNLMLAGSILLYFSIALGLTAWILSWVITIRTRNLAHFNTIPRSACCGNLPAALYVGVTATLLSFLGVILSWVGYNNVISLLPTTIVSQLRLNSPPGGVAVVFGLLFQCGGCAVLWWAHSALGNRPVPFLTGEGFLSWSPVERMSKLDGGMGKSKAPLGGEEPTEGRGEGGAKLQQEEGGSKPQQQRQQSQSQLQLQPQQTQGSSSRVLSLPGREEALALPLPEPVPRDLEQDLLSRLVSQKTESHSASLRRVSTIQQTLQEEVLRAQAAAYDLEAATALAEEHRQQDQNERLILASAENILATIARRNEASPSPTRTLASSLLVHSQRMKEESPVRKLSPAAFKLLKSKGALSETGQYLGAVNLTEEEEDLVNNTEVLIKLAELKRSSPPVPAALYTVSPMHKSASSLQRLAPVRGQTNAEVFIT